uniref:Uncharacterized protein n=2 Tax=Anguilla anguilla TaxID=7936 RepID=A0A0E9UAI6_ANGAN
MTAQLFLRSLCVCGISSCTIRLSKGLELILGVESAFGVGCSCLKCQCQVKQAIIRLEN